MFYAYDGKKYYGTRSDVVYAKVTIGKPALTAVAQDGVVTLSWQAMGGVTRFSLYRGTSATSLIYYKGIAGSAISYTDTVVTPGETYYYRMTPTRTEDGKKTYGQKSDLVSVTLLSE